MEWLTLPQWSPYIVGAGIGILSWFTFLVSQKPLGVSSSYVRSCAMIEKFFFGQKTENNRYYHAFAPAVDWEWMLVAGLIVGAFLSAIFSGEFQWRWVPELWQERFGHVPGTRVIVAFIGGIVMQCGARWAGGCTSGHGISGTLQLAVSSWVALICFFIGGIMTAALIYGR